MLILGVDPGYRKLGLAVVDSDTKEVLHTRTVDCGQIFYKMHYAVLRALADIAESYGIPDLVATEKVPNGFAGRSSGGRTACTMHWVAGGIGYWAAQHGIPVRDITPKGLKSYAAKVTGTPLREWEGPTGSRAKLKSGISEAVGILTGSKAHKTDHEADAVLVALAFSQ